MAIWKISREAIRLFPHTDPTVESLQLGKVGQYQVVVQKGLYQDGQIIIFVPDKSILPDKIADQGDIRKYLVGLSKNRVKSIRLRGELSCGMILPDQPEFKDIPIGEDISEKIGITKYEPPIPPKLAGQVDSLGNISLMGHELTQHDVEQFGIYKDEFPEGQLVEVSEKLHGSLCCVIRLANGERVISSKGLLSRGLILKDDGKNGYWEGAKNTGIFDILDKYYPNQHVQAFGELLPTQGGGFTYGFNTLTVRYFRVDLNGQSIPLDDIPKEIRDMFVPILYRGPFDLAKIMPLREGSETVSGKEIHKKEGLVVKAVPYRRAKDGTQLMVKLLNPAYKETGEEFN